MYSSVFPAEIFQEIESIDFTSFNNQEGTYQMMVPRLLHFVHTSLVELCVMTKIIEDDILRLKD